MAKLFHNMATSVIILFILSLMLGEQDFVTSHMPKKKLEVWSSSYKEERNNNHQSLSGLKAHTQGVAMSTLFHENSNHNKYNCLMSQMPKNFEVWSTSLESNNKHQLLGGLKAHTKGAGISSLGFGESDSNQYTRCSKYLKTTSLICGLDDLELARNICDLSICREHRRHIFGYCDNINDLINIVGQENIEEEVEEEEEQEEENRNANENNDEVQIMRKTGSFKGRKYASLDHYDDLSTDVIEDIPKSVNCFCCKQLA